MNIAQSASHRIFMTLCLVILAACQTATPTPSVGDSIQIDRINDNATITGQLIQTKTFNQCNAASSFNSQVTFSETSSETTQKELILSEVGGAEVSVPTLAKVKLEAAIEERFAAIKQSSQSHEESVTINVPAHTRQEYTIIWRETRREGIVEYTVNGVPRVANFSYRIGLEFVSATGSDVDCFPPTVTPIPSDTPLAPTMTAPATLQPRTIADGCIFSKTWRPDSPDASLLDTIAIGSDGCYSMYEFGIFANPGTLHFYKKTSKNTSTAGIYTPINSNSDIRFDIYVNSLSMRPDSVAEIIFAIAPANDRLTVLSTTRFKLHVQDPGEKKVIHFTMADAGEPNGVNLGTQHYEYGRTYNIRLRLDATRMEIFINGFRMPEKLELPIGAKVFYIGYDLPIQTELDATISNITVDNVVK